MTREKIIDIIQGAANEDEIIAAISTLTLTEQSIIEILIHQKHALSIGEIRNIFIYAMYSHILLAASRAQIITAHQTPYFPGLIKKPPRLTQQSLKSLVSFFRKIPARVPEYRRLKLLNKILSKHHIPTIGDSTILSKVENLTLEGLLQKRSTASTSKANTLYFLNPSVRDKLSSIVKKKRG